mmetsp:Transcript_81341/g.143431  ORF Transcript_81341/g.143431 Transcript_81341/m.143431 type:complete len:532 (-) Transcript_81341:611-2206(-)
MTTRVCGASLLMAVLVLVWPHCTTSMSRDETLRMRTKVKEMFDHGYRSYMDYAFPCDELQPVTCSGMETWGGYSLTLIDALDTLVVVGEHDEFLQQSKWVWEHISFEKDVNVSVFETNIRVLGGLLAAHLIYEEGIVDPAAVGYTGQLLQMAADLGYRLLQAFDTPTGIPYGTVNLMHGVPNGEVEVTSTASGGTFLLEFTMLSKLIGDDIFQVAAKRASVGLFKRRSSLGLVGNHINITSGEWTHKDAGIGSGIDSFYEYLFKAHMLYRDSDLWHMFNESRSAIAKWLYKPPWYIEVHMHNGMTVWPIYNSLQAFWPGTQALAGNLQQAKETVRAMHGIWRRFGAVPEGFNLLHGKVQPGQSSYPLRPELAESIYYLYHSTHDPTFLHMGRDMVYAINTRARTSCGFATLDDVESTNLANRMESFFLSETLKYLYLLFDKGNIFNQQYVFTTEGHVLPIHAEYKRSQFWRTQPKTHETRETINHLRYHRAQQNLQPYPAFSKKEIQCPRATFWKQIGVCEMEVKTNDKSD